jgi:drug/metabolite transporter (DMT)-like permease
LLARRATGGDAVAFVWLTSALSAALYVPVVIVLVATTHVHLRDGPLDVGMMAGTGVLHQIYFLLLQRGFCAGSFSLVYPLARGTGPLVASLAAIGLFGEKLTGPHALGIALILIAIFVITGGRTAEPVGQPSQTTLRLSLQYGVATGLSIAAYTLWDKQAVSAFAISPILYDFGRTAAQTLLMSGPVLRSAERRRTLRVTWHDFRGEAVGVAILSPLAYVFILYALTVAPVSVVAPLREISIVIGAFMGAHVLREGQLGRRLIAASIMLLGIVALAAR